MVKDNKLRGSNNEQSQNRGRGVGRVVRGGVGRGSARVANRGNRGENAGLGHGDVENFRGKKGGRPAKKQATDIAPNLSN